GTFDGVTLRLYVNGRLAASQASKHPTIAEGKNFFMGKSAGEVRYTKNAHFKGMVDEVRIYNRPLSPEEVQKHYRTTNLTRQMGLRPSLNLFGGELIVGLELRGLGELPAGAAAEVALCKPGEAKPLCAGRVEPLPSWGKAEAKLKVGDLTTGDYELRAAARDKEGKPIGLTTAQTLNWPTKPSWPGGDSMKVLNSLVTELLRVQPTAGMTAFRFTNPRDGWVFISSTADGGLWLSLDEPRKEKAILAHEKSGTLEAMRRLPAGQHTIHVGGEGNARPKDLIVRAIPELIYCKFGSNPHIEQHGPYNYEFLQRHVLPHVNTIVGTGSQEQQPYVEQWKARGGKWIVECPLPGLSAESVTADEAEKAWTANPGMKSPLLDGLIVDEFWTGLPEQKYAAWTEALLRIHNNPQFKGKTLNPYCGPMHGTEGSRRFAKSVVDCGGKFALERYLPEQRSEADARAYLNSTLTDTVRAWREAMPGIERHIIFCFGYLCAPPESVNIDPSVNWLTYMDMQVRHVATSPACFGAHGLMFYTSSYADEESVRWAARLYRHYGIEGRTEPLSKDPYLLTHLHNPDFDEGMSGWTLSPAEDGSISAKTMSGLSWLQGRYPRTSVGDNFLWLRRSARKPNVVTQEVKNLQPGRLYSLKLFTADYGDLTQGKSVKQKHAVSIALDGVELVPDKCFQHAYPNCYSHHLPPFDAKHRAWLNFHQRVFRAKAMSARLTLSDWASSEAPGGDAGQELALNFVEVQPYLED
ncbi:MAG: LamG domain-containing protein, partial [Planctomycetes bacterium]|nr:LamG domain-containing protein [Planctomycetota bacterium]